MASLSLMISPAASIRSIVILSGPGALPFLDCLIADLTSQAFMLGKPSNCSKVSKDKVQSLQTE